MALEERFVDDVDDDDDDYGPVVAVECDEPTIGICPACGKPPSSHSLLEAVRCNKKLDEREEAKAAEPPAVDREPLPVVTASPASAPAVEPEAHELADLPPRTLPLLADGGIDYEALANGMRIVLEKERDEIIRRGGPIEKQNIELKERLHDALEDAGRWRQKAETNAAQRNLLKEQLDEQIKANRKLRNELKGRKESGNHTRLVELNEILDVVSKTPGFTIERAGNGHFLIKQRGVFVTDMASSGQGNKVNMASRIALRKAGVDV